MHLQTHYHCHSLIHQHTHSLLVTHNIPTYLIWNSHLFCWGNRILYMYPTYFCGKIFGWFFICAWCPRTPPAWDYTSPLLHSLLPASPLCTQLPALTTLCPTSTLPNRPTHSCLPRPLCTWLPDHTTLCPSSTLPNGPTHSCLPCTRLPDNATLCPTWRFAWRFSRQKTLNIFDSGNLKHWKLGLCVNFNAKKNRQYCFRYWLITTWATGHYLNHWGFVNLGSENGTVWYIVC